MKNKENTKDSNLKYEVFVFFVKKTFISFKSSE